MEQLALDETESPAVAQLVEYLVENKVPCCTHGCAEVKTTFVGGINPWTGERDAEPSD